MDSRSLILPISLFTLLLPSDDSASEPVAARYTHLVGLGDARELTFRSTGCFSHTMPFDAKSAADSYLDWWFQAGLTEGVAETQQSWLTTTAMPGAQASARHVSQAMPAQFPPQAQAQAQPRPDAIADHLPNELEALDRWFADQGAGLCPEGAGRLVLPSGPQHPRLMILSDMPDEADLVQGQLFSGQHRVLLSAMLSAIGLDLAGQRLASILLTRPHVRQLEPRQRSRIDRVLNHHIRLVGPDILFLLGTATCRMVTGRTEVPAPEDQPFFNHDGVKTAVFATHHPRMLIDRPQSKRHAWEVLKRMKDLLGT